MIRYLADPANAVTTAGLLFSALGLDLALAHRPELAVAAVLWAMLADQLDGVVAKRTPGRSIEVATIGKALDGFADLLYGAVFPAVILMTMGGASSLSFLSGTALLLAGAIRLSYFSTFGLSSDGRFTGVPLSYDVPLLAIVFLVRPLLPAESFGAVLNFGFLALAALHVLLVRVPAPNTAMYGVITAFSIASSACLALRGLA